MKLLRLLQQNILTAAQDISKKYFLTVAHRSKINFFIMINVCFVKVNNITCQSNEILPHVDLNHNPGIF